MTPRFQRPQTFAVWADEWAAGRRTDVPPEVMDLLLLEALPGYTRDALHAEPAAVVNRWWTVLQARNRQEAKQTREAERRAGGRHGR